MKIAYLLPRPPDGSQPLIRDELDHLDAIEAIEIDSIMSLLAASGLDAQRSAWGGRARRPGPTAALAGLIYWLLRRPGRTAGLFIRTLATCWRSPVILGRALMTIPIAAAHARYLRTRQVQHLHAHIAGYAAWCCSRLTDTPFSVTVHDTDLHPDRRLPRLTLPEARFTATTSDYNRDVIAGEIPWLDPMPSVLRGAINLAAVRFRPRTPPPSGPVLTVCLAPYGAQHGQGVLLNALHERREQSRLWLELAGMGSSRSLQRQAEELGLSEAVSFLGALPDEAITELLDEADLLIAPSRIAADGQPGDPAAAVLRALAAGVPVISTRLFGMPELIEDGVTGYLAAPGDSKSLADSIERALDPGSKLDLAQGRRLVEERFDPTAHAARLAQLMQRTEP